LPTLQEEGKFVNPPNKARQDRTTGGIKTALKVASPDNTEKAHFAVEAFEGARAKILDLERLANQDPGPFRHRQLIRFGAVLYPANVPSCRPALLKSPTTTRSVAIPTLAWTCRPPTIPKVCTASRASSPARTARSAWSSNAVGQPKKAITPSPRYWATWPP